MIDVRFIEHKTWDGKLIESVILDYGNGEYTAMPKSVWDEIKVNFTQQENVG